MMSPEELEALDGIAKKYSNELAKPMIRMYGIIFGLSGWMMYCHWHVVPAAIVWTFAALFFLVSYKKNLA
jgi:hypothetical protein